MTMSRPVRLIQQYFYLFMSLLIAAVVTYGFSQTIDRGLLHASPIPPFIVTIHAIVFPGWVLFFILQSALVRTHNVRIHRTLGWFGVVLAATVVVVGLLTVRGMDRFKISLHPKAQPGVSAFLFVQLSDLVFFPLFFSLAIYWRRKPEFHRRLVLIASCVLTNAAWARFPHSSGILMYAGVDLLVLLGILRDLIVDRRIHKVYLYALPLLIASQTLALYTVIHRPPWWMHLANAILR